MISKKGNGQKFETCPVCQSSKIAFRLNTFDRHYLQHHQSFDVYRCTDCSLLFLNPMITEEELHDLYPKDSYYAYTEIAPFAVQKKVGLMQRLKRLVINTSSRDPEFLDISSLSVLDVGCGSGEKLAEFRQAGWKKVQGVEIDKRACEIGKANGIDIFHGTLLEAAFPSNSFDYVRSNHSFEHIIQNKAVIAEMFRICRPGGKLFIGVPNTGSLNFRLFGKYWYFLGIPFHPFGYNPKNLRLLLDEAGFEVEKVVHNGSALGILGSMQIALNSRRGIKHSQGFLLKKIFELPVHQLARLLNFARTGDCIEIIARKPGNNIA
ncbi:MAG TPA: class I SAM-dependent methyltransferase [Flavisolibacter sp.]|nr:class I SAM-dependent methyltransferase [Flavisolibacter sp.]